MQIIIKQGEEETILAAGPARAIGEPVGPSSLRLGGSVALQMRRHMRAAAAKAENRGNLESSIGWTVSYEFATQYEAELFAVTHAADVLREDQLRLVVADPVGGNTIIQVSDVLIKVVDPVMVGVTVTVTYSAIGGKAERIET